jgi:hypothetical protein
MPCDAPHRRGIVLFSIGRIVSQRRKRTRRVLPEPGGFTIVKMPRDEWRRVLDPEWEPVPESVKFLGRYIKSQYRERDQRAQVLMRIRADGTREEVRFMLGLYFDDPASRAIFGDVKILGVDVPTSDVFVVRISTERRDVRYFARPK